MIFKHVLEDVLAEIGDGFVVGSLLHDVLAHHVGLLVLALPDILEKLCIGSGVLARLRSGRRG